MSTQTRTDERRHYSPSASIVYAMSPVVQAIIVLAAIAAIGVSTYAAVKASIAERESRLQRLETDEMNVRLELAGIPKHKPGDKP